MSGLIGDDLDAAFAAELQQEAESRMRSTCEIQFEVGTEPDPDTDSDVPIYETFLATKCRVKSPGNVLRIADVGGRSAASSTRELHIPVHSPDPWSDPRCAGGVTALVTASENPALVGRRVKLDGPGDGDQTTARRLQITEVVS